MVVVVVMEMSIWKDFP